MTQATACKPEQEMCVLPRPPVRPGRYAPITISCWSVSCRDCSNREFHEVRPAGLPARHPIGAIQEHEERGLGTTGDRDRPARRSQASRGARTEKGQARVGLPGWHDDWCGASVRDPLAAATADKAPDMRFNLRLDEDVAVGVHVIALGVAPDGTAFRTDFVRALG